MRQEQTQVELQRLQRELGAWLEHRRARDQAGQYRTQLDAVEALVRGALRQLTAAASALDSGRAQGEIYEACRLLDMRLVWLRRVWQFFRDKFDQRDDPHLAPLLKAADEVVWSCYRQVFVQAELRRLPIRQGPAPLPFVESQFSPEAFPAELVPPGLNDVRLGGDFLREHLNRLPIPVVRLPPMCVSSPWMLVYLGHEVGHHVQYQLKDNLEALREVRQAVETALETHGVAEDEVAAWGRWSTESFADVFAVLVMGQWAVRAMAELELARSQTMLQRRPLYPSPLVRLWLLAEAADRVGLDGSRVLRQAGLRSADASRANPDLARVQCVVGVLMGTLPGLSVTLQHLCAFRADDFRPGGAVERWSAALRGRLDRSPEATLRAARVVASASLAAWSEVACIEADDVRAAARADLAERTRDLVARSREEGTRGDHAAAVSADALGAELGQVLLAATPRQLEG